MCKVIVEHDHNEGRSMPGSHYSSPIDIHVHVHVHVHDMYHSHILLLHIVHVHVHVSLAYFVIIHCTCK